MQAQFKKKEMGSSKHIMLFFHGSLWTALGLEEKKGLVSRLLLHFKKQYVDAGVYGIADCLATVALYLAAFSVTASAIFVRSVPQER